MKNVNKKKRSDVSLNIWVACSNFRIATGQKMGALRILKNHFLFLIGEKDDSFIFKDEDGKKIQIHKKIAEANYIRKVF